MNADIGYLHTVQTHINKHAHRDSQPRDRDGAERKSEGKRERKKKAANQSDKAKKEA